MTEVHVFRRANKKKYVKKDGTVSYYPSTNTVHYRCKLHHPDAAEMDQILAELAAGHLKKDVAARHNLGKSNVRLNNLLTKHAALGPRYAPPVAYRVIRPNDTIVQPADQDGSQTSQDVAQGDQHSRVLDQGLPQSARDVPQASLPSNGRPNSIPAKRKRRVRTI